MKRRLIAAVFVLALGGAVGACGRGGPSRDAHGDTPEAPVRRDLPADVAITASGATDVSLASRLSFTVSKFEPERRDLSLLTVGIAEFAPLADGRRVRLAVDLAGVYHGPGRYEFGGGGGGSGQMSAAFLHVVELRDQAAGLDEANIARATSFDRLQAPCVIDVEDGERSGTLHCPRVAAADGTEIDLHLTWTAA